MLAKARQQGLASAQSVTALYDAARAIREGPKMAATIVPNAASIAVVPTDGDTVTIQWVGGGGDAGSLLMTRAHARKLGRHFAALYEAGELGVD